MKFTTNLERYFFAKACEMNADKMWTFCLRKRNKSKKGSKANTYWNSLFQRYLHQSNFWAKVAERFEDDVFKGISEKLEINLKTNGMIPTKEAE